MKEKIKALLKERRAIILAHNYQPPEIQDVADMCGDSLELSIKAAETDAEVIPRMVVDRARQQEDAVFPHQIVTECRY